MQLVWEQLEPPRALELMPHQVGSGIHSMFSVLVPAQQGSIVVNGQPLARQARHAGAGRCRNHHGVPLFHRNLDHSAGRAMSETILHAADRAACEKMRAADPVWDAVVSGAEAYGHEKQPAAACRAAVRIDRGDFPADPELGLRRGRVRGAGRRFRRCRGEDPWRRNLPRAGAGQRRGDAARRRGQRIHGAAPRSRPRLSGQRMLCAAEWRHARADAQPLLQLPC